MKNRSLIRAALLAATLATMLVRTPVMATVYSGASAGMSAWAEWKDGWVYVDQNAGIHGRGTSAYIEDYASDCFGYWQPKPGEFVIDPTGSVAQLTSGSPCGVVQLTWTATSVPGVWEWSSQWLEDMNDAGLWIELGTWRDAAASGSIGGRSVTANYASTGWGTDVGASSWGAPAVQRAIRAHRWRGRF